LIVDPCIKFEYEIVYGGESMMNNNGNTLTLTGEFGQFIYQDTQVFQAYEMVFHS
jgi:hypothetical protein